LTWVYQRAAEGVCYVNDTEIIVDKSRIRRIICPRSRPLEDRLLAFICLLASDRH